MQVKCDYCDSLIEDTDVFCPHCGAPNEHLAASAAGVPKTIEELKQFCADHKLPLKDMRFFIGEDCREPKAFGIYRDTDSGEVVVYKNKADGTRAVRYQGDDEAYGVHEIWEKMRSEIANQRNYQARKAAAGGGRQPTATGPGHVNKPNKLALALKALAVAGVVGFVAFFAYMVITSPDPGYYSYNDTHYYLQGTNWYVWDDDDDDWRSESDPPEELSGHPNDYYTGYDWDSSDPFGDFTESEAYQTFVQEQQDSDDDWDDDWDDDDWSWDSGDTWDSGATDWDSDW